MAHLIMLHFTTPEQFNEREINEAHKIAPFFLDMSDVKEVFTTTLDLTQSRAERGLVRACVFQVARF